jgi:hypothetical protein
MGLIFAAPAAPLAVNAIVPSPLFVGPMASAAPGTAYFGPTPAAVAGLAGWWDAGVLGSMQDPVGNTINRWNNVVSALTNKVSGGPSLTPYSMSTDTKPNATLAVPRVNGFLGAVGSPDRAVALYGPTLDPDWGLVLPTIDLGTNTGWTLYLVWTRPNWRQGTIAVNDAPIPLLHASASGVTIMQAGGPDGRGLTLFAGTQSAMSITANLTRRHSHAIIIRHTPNVGVDVYIDNVLAVSGAVNPLPASSPGPLLFLHDGTVQGSAQCWFHEAAIWAHALNQADIATLISCQTRWVLGPRRGVNLMVMGQSNAEWFTYAGGALALAQGVCWYLGAASYAATYLQSGNNINPPRYSMIAGHPISNSSPPLFPPGVGSGTFLTNPGDGSDPSNWALGPDGIAVQDYLTGSQALVPPADLSDIAFLLWPWSEQDSTMPYSNKALYSASVLRLATLTRAMFGRSAEALPLLMWSAIPYETDVGVQMVREAVADIAAVSANAVAVFVAQTADSNPLNATWNSQTGVFSGGDPEHRDLPDLLRYGQLGAHVAGRVAIAMGLSDSIPATALPSVGLPTSNGPRITHAYQSAPTQVILTIVHDAGNDLIVPLLSNKGVGFALMDGGSPAAPGPIIDAVAVSRIDATHLAVTLASAPINPAANCLLYYPYGSTQMGRGNAVTDNLAQLTAPVDWDIASDLGDAFLTNMPLQATAYGVPLSVSAA